MGRFFAIIVLFVILAFAVNYLIQDQRATTAELSHQSSTTNVAVAQSLEIPPPVAPTSNTLEPVETTSTGAAAGDAVATDAATDDTATDDTVVDDGATEEIATEEIATEENANVEGATGNTATIDGSQNNSTNTVETSAAEPAAKPAAAEVGEEEIMLGGHELTSGIPGEGPLSVDDIRAWLSDPRNHFVIKPLLPKGLAAGAQQIVGVDENPLTRAKIELGRQLYFDTRLSGDNTVSCASCHDPEFGYAKATQFGIGVGGQTGDRNSPVAYNRILSGPQFWDGRAASLEDQAVGPIANAIEMANTHEMCVDTLSKVDGYRLQFEKIFDEGATIDNVGKAIASFERVIVTGPTPWDYYVELRDFEKAFGADLEDIEALQEDDPVLYDEYMALKQASDAHPLDESARRGGELFFSDKTGCTACHVGANFTDEKYHNLGVGMEADEPDVGRYKVTEQEEHRGAFKTPTVRNVALTAPYMHDGSQETLEEVVEWYAKGGHPNPHLSDKIKKLDLTEQDKTDLVAFMKALTGEFPEVRDGRLPN